MITQNKTKQKQIEYMHSDKQRFDAIAWSKFALLVILHSVLTVL